MKDIFTSINEILILVVILLFEIRINTFFDIHIIFSAIGMAIGVVSIFFPIFLAFFDNETSKDPIYEKMGKLDTEINSAEARGEDTSELLAEFKKLVDKVKEVKTCPLKR